MNAEGLDLARPIRVILEQDNIDGSVERLVVRKIVPYDNESIHFVTRQVEEESDLFERSVDKVIRPRKFRVYLRVEGKLIEEGGSLYTVCKNVNRVVLPDYEESGRG